MFSLLDYIQASRLSQIHHRLAITSSLPCWAWYSGQEPSLTSWWRLISHLPHIRVQEQPQDIQFTFRTTLLDSSQHPQTSTRHLSSGRLAHCHATILTSIVWSFTLKSTFLQLGVPLSPNKTEALTTYLKLLGITLDTLSFQASLPTPLYFFVHFKLPSCLPMYQVSASLFTCTPEFLHPHQTYSSPTYCPCRSSAFNHYVILDDACKINTGRVSTCSWTLWPPHPTPFISPFSNLSSPPSRTLHSSPLKTLLPILPEPSAIIINYLLYLATAVVLWCAKSSNTALTIVS